MRIVEQSPMLLVLRQQRFGQAALMAVFTLLSLLMLVNVLTQGLPRLADGMNLYQIISWLIWLGLAVLLVMGGSVITSSAYIGMRCTFDKHAETVTLKRPRWLRAISTTHSIYSIARADVERNDEVRAFAVFLVLRSGERLTLATLPIHDEDHAYAIARAIRQFLQARPA